MVKTQRVVITPGEPAGIGPDLVVQLAQREWPVELVVCADATLLTDRAAMLGLPLTLRPYSPNSPAQPQTTGTLTLLPVALRESVTAGQLAIENGHYVVETLARASCNVTKEAFPMIRRVIIRPATETSMFKDSSSWLSFASNSSCNWSEVWSRRKSLGNATPC